jgi:hypothetical protein
MKFQIIYRMDQPKSTAGWINDQLSDGSTKVERLVFTGTP